MSVEKKKQGRPPQHGKHGKGRNTKAEKQRIMDIAAAIPECHGNYLAISKKVGLERHIVSKIINDPKNTLLKKAFEESQINVAFEYKQRIHDWIMAGKDGDTVLPPTPGQVKLMQIYIENHPDHFDDWQKKKDEPVALEVSLELIARALENQTKNSEEKS